MEDLKGILLNFLEFYSINDFYCETYSERMECVNKFINEQNKLHKEKYNVFDLFDKLHELKVKSVTENRRSGDYRIGISHCKRYIVDYLMYSNTDEEESSLKTPIQ